MKRVVEFVGLFLTLTGTALAQSETPQIFACIEHGAAGMNHKGGTYQTTTFHEDKFTMTMKGRMLTIKLKASEVSFTCSKPYQLHPEALDCSERFHSMGFNLNTLDFTRATYFGPMTGDGNGGDSLRVSYGTCQKF